MTSKSNNYFLEKIAGTDLDGLTNNQLLAIIAEVMESETPIVRQAPIAELDPDSATQADIVDKLNQIIEALKKSNVTE